MNRLLGFGGPYSPQVNGLLGIDPQEMRKQALYNGLANAGFTLMATNDLGDVGAAALLGVNQGRQRYIDDAITGYRLNQDVQEAERRNQEEADRAAALEMFPPEMQPIVKAYPQLGQEYLQRQYFPDQPSSADRYKVVGNNMYDTQTGQWLSSPNGSQPDLPKGYRWKQDGSGAEPIPGVTVPGAPKPYTLTSGDKQAIRNAAAENVVLKQTLENLKEARAIAPDTNTGYFAASRASVAENMPDGLVPDMVFGSPKEGEATLRFKQIMDAEALASIGALLKGPTSDRDVRIMLETVNDPRASASRKQASIDRVASLIEAQLAQNNDMMQGLKSGEFYGGAGGGQNGPLVTPDGYTIELME